MYRSTSSALYNDIRQHQCLHRKHYMIISKKERKKTGKETNIDNN